MTESTGVTVTDDAPSQGGGGLQAPRTRAAVLAARSVQRTSPSERRGFIIRRLSVLADVVALLVVGLLSLATLALAGRPIIGLDIVVFLAFVPVWPLIAIATRAYHPAAVGRGLSITIADEFGTIFRVATLWSWFLLLTRSVASADPIQMIPSLLVWAISIPVVLLSRSVLRQFARKRGWYHQEVLVIGRAADASRIVSRIRRHPEWGLSVAEEIDVGDGGDGGWMGDGHPARHVSSVRSEEILEQVRGSTVSRVVFATPPGQLDARTDLTRSFIEAGLQVDFVPGEAEVLRSGAVITNLEGLPLMSMPGARQPRSWGVLKRTMDVAVALPALAIVSPVIVYYAIRIKLDSPGPVFYSQLRAGRDGENFSFLKLRTMSVGADERQQDVASMDIHGQGIDQGTFKAVDDPRVTKVGKRLRHRSLDELPQLWNVVRGDMSLVGPRPLPVYEDERVAGHYEVRRHVRPGMTGPWQVNGRSDIPFHDMLRLDYSYVLNWSLTADLKLLVQTVDAVLRGRGAY